MKNPHDHVLAEDIARLDQNTESLGIPPQLLMECAGLQATNEIERKFSTNPEKDTFEIFCGTGNNGGDGFVVARHLVSRGYKVTAILIGKGELIRTKEAKLNWKILSNLPINLTIQTIIDSSEVNNYFETLNFSCSDEHLKEFNVEKPYLIDAILGTGIKGKLREPVSTVISSLNSLKSNTGCKIIALDVPSGMDPNTGNITDKAVNCDYRITFHKDKTGMISTSTIENTIVVPIGTPIEAHLFVGKGDLKQCLKIRARNTHKGQFGKVLVIGGSQQYSGAPALAAMITQKLGLDLVNCFVPKSISEIVKKYSPNLIVREAKGDNFSLEDLEYAKELAMWADAVLIGPGIGIAQETNEFLNEFLPWINMKNIPYVIDADAIKTLRKLFNNKTIVKLSGNAVITPHMGELNIILNEKHTYFPLYNHFDGRGEFLTQLLNKFSGVFLVKDVYDYIISPDSNDLKYRVNLSGCPEMSVGGTGDVLAGMVAGFLALGNSPSKSACAAAYLNGRLGEESVKNLGNRIQATDLINLCREFIKENI